MLIALLLEMHTQLNAMRRKGEQYTQNEISVIHCDVCKSITIICLSGNADVTHTLTYTGTRMYARRTEESHTDTMHTIVHTCHTDTMHTQKNKSTYKRAHSRSHTTSLKRGLFSHIIQTTRSRLSALLSWSDRLTILTFIL